MRQRAVGRLHREGDASRIMRCALLLRRHGATGATEVALRAEGGFIALAAAPGVWRGPGPSPGRCWSIFVWAALLAWGGLSLWVWSPANAGECSSQAERTALQSPVLLVSFTAASSALSLFCRERFAASACSHQFDAQEVRTRCGPRRVA